MKKAFTQIMAVAAVFMLAFVLNVGAENVSWETNLTATVINATDTTNSTVVFQPVGTKVPIRYVVETPAAGAVAWALAASSITTSTVANLPAIPKSTYNVIDLGGGNTGALHMRFQTVETNLVNTIKIKVVGYQ